MATTTTLKLSNLNPTDRIITFNIGGQIFSTKYSTISNNVDCQSFLVRLIDNQPSPNGQYFIDRDGKYFSYILNYFREKKLILSENNDELQQLLVEAKFYQIDRLINEIENRFNRNNEKYQRDCLACPVMIVSKLQHDRRVDKFIGSLQFIYLFRLTSIGEKFLKMIASSFRELNKIQCQFTFPFQEKLISCQPMNQLEKFVLAKHAKKLGLMVSYSEDYFYLPIERDGFSRDELAEFMFKKYQGKLLNSNIIQNDEGYNLVENWLLMNSGEEIYSNTSLTSVQLK